MTLLAFFGFDDTVKAETGADSYTTMPGNAAGRYSGNSFSHGINGLGFPVQATGNTIIHGCAIKTTAYSGLGAYKPGVGYMTPGVISFREDSKGTSPRDHIAIVAEAGNNDKCRFAVYLGVPACSGTGQPPNRPPLVATDYIYELYTWYYLEAKVIIADVNGSVEILIGGRSVLTYNGDTQTGGDGSCNSVIHSSFVAPGYQSGDAFYIDDAYIVTADATLPNDYLHDVRVRSLHPTGNGSSSEFTNSAGTTVDNYTYVDSANAQSTTYVEAATSDLTDLYTFDQLTADDEPIAVQALTYAWRTDAGTTPNLAAVAKGPLGTVRTDPNVSLSATNQNLIGDIYLTDPDGNALTYTAVNESEYGVTSTP